jgi:hypothetical protein
LFSHTPVTNPIAAQAVLQQALHEQAGPLAGSVESYGYLTVPKRSNSTNQYQIHFCSTGVAVAASNEPATYFERRADEDFKLDGADIVSRTICLRTKGLKRRALEELVGAMRTWCRYDIFTSNLAMDFFDKYKSFFPDMLADDFYPFCSGGLAETEITVPPEIGIPLVNFDAEIKNDSGESRYAGIVFYKDNAIACADNQSSQEMEWIIIPLGTQSPVTDLPAGGPMEAIECFFESLPQKRSPRELLRQMLSEWSQRSKEIGALPID